MPIKLSRKPDPRFIRHGIQPRAQYLNKRQYQVCKVDYAFKEALRVRVSNGDRWDAFIAGRSYYTGNPCKRCQSHRRRVVNNNCYDCTLSRNKADFTLIRQGIAPPAKQTRDGWLDKHERSKREKFGECLRYEIGKYLAEQFPTGRVRLIVPHLLVDAHDLVKEIEPQRLHQMARDPDFLALLKKLGWA